MLQGYAHHFGPLWSASSSQPMERMMEVMMNAYSTLSTPLKWLMGAHDIAVPNLQQQRECRGLFVLARQVGGGVCKCQGLLAFARQ